MINEYAHGELIEAITIIPKSELTEFQLDVMRKILEERLPQDIGAWTAWEEVGAQTLLHVPFLRSEPISVLHAGGPPKHIVPAWWLRPKFRAQSLGKPVAIAFARYLRSRGITGAGRVQIDGPDWKKSQSLLDAFISELHKGEPSSS